MKRYCTLMLVAWGLAWPTAGAQDLTLTDRDLERYEEEEPSSDAGLEEIRTRREEREAAGEPYDETMLALKEQLRNVENELEGLPEKLIDLRSRLATLEASEEDLRREAFTRIVAPYPYSYFEDFDEAINQALERQERRAQLAAEIRETEAIIAGLEAERDGIRNDIKQAYGLKQDEVSDVRRRQNRASGASAGAEE